jgi:hypothetical protein
LCNLSLAIVRPDDTEAELMEKVYYASVFGTLQSLFTAFGFVRDSWRQNAEEERLLGVDLLGALDNPLLREDNPDRENLLTRLKDEVVRANEEWATYLGVNPSVAATVIKPGGNSSVRWMTGQTTSGWMSQYMIRNVQVGRNNPMHSFLVDAGVPYEPYYNDPDNTSVFSFPMQAPEGARIVADLETGQDGSVTAIKPRDGAIRQLEQWEAFNDHWAEHAVSCTIYVADHEWLDVGRWVYERMHKIKGLSFLPLDGGVYPQAPMQPVTKEQYEAFCAKFPDINWAKYPMYEAFDQTQMAHEVACSGEACAI